MKHITGNTYKTRIGYVFEIAAAIAILIILSQGLLIVVHGRSLILFTAYLLMFALHAAMQPLLNSINATMIGRGIAVDYGSCRAMGSLGYALMSAGLSVMVIRFTALSPALSAQLSYSLWSKKPGSKQRSKPKVRFWPAPQLEIRTGR